MNKYEAMQLARKLRKNQTAEEGIFWELVRNKRFLGFKFNRQYPIEYNKGKFFIVDFYCHTAKLIVEIDGEIHKYQKDYDQGRTNIITELGYTILRFDNITVFNQTQLVSDNIRRFLKDACRTLPQPLSSKRGVPKAG